MAPRFKLKLTSLKFISAVDAGAQGEISNVALLKRHDATGIEATCQVIKVDSSLGLVFGWALASSLDGGKTQHVDLQGDAIQNDDLIKVAAEFMESAARSDVMHDDAPDGRIVFAMPLIPEINAALGISSDVHGLAIAMKPSAETFKRFQSGELKAFSIAGQGERTPLVEKVAPGSLATTTLAAALASKSTRPQTTVKKDSIMTFDEALAEIADLKAKLSELDKAKESMDESMSEAEKRATLTDAQRTYHKSLDKADAAAFLAKSFSERETVLAAIEKANEIVYTSKSTSETFRKSDDARLVTMAKRQDEQAAELAKRDLEIKKAHIRKVASEILKNAPGDNETHDFIIEAIEGNEKAIATIKGLMATSTIGKNAAGASGEGEPTNAAGELEAAIAKHATDHKCSRPEATAAVLATPVGKRLYAAANV